MKKTGLAVFALAAVMSLGAVGVTAFAATGWAQEGNNWVYYNNNGSKVTNAWRQAQDGTWRYLESSGAMAADKWVDNDDYYVDSSGIMITNKWLQVANSRKASGYDWYYFGTNGKCLKEKWAQIDGQYRYFGDTGAMETGWVLDNMYYCDDSGVMVTGWKKLTPPEEYQDEDTHTGPFETVSDGQYWYYFGTNGKKVVPNENGTNVKQKKINGTYYCLREDGAVQTGWVCVTGDESDSIEDYRLVDTDGKVRTGWYSAEPPGYLASHYDHDVEWFYFNSKGVPEVGPAKGSAKTSDLKRINGYTHLFNEYGTPVYGIQKVYTSSNGNEYTAYYFGNYPQSSMLTGKYNITEGGVSWPYYFNSTGKGYTGVYDNCLYYMGKLQKADSGSKYEVFTIPTGNSYKNYVVNTSGKIAKNTTVKDSNGVKYKTNSSGILVKEDDESVAGGDYRSPEEPEWDND